MLHTHIFGKKKPITPKHRNNFVTPLAGQLSQGQTPPVTRGQTINANFFCTKFFENPSGHGRPRRTLWTSTPKVGFSAAPVMGRNFLTQGRLGVRVGHVRRKSGPKSLCLCCFFFPESRGQTGQNGEFTQGGSGTEPEPETGTVRTVFPETENGTGTARTVFQEPKPEPSFPLKMH